MKGSGLAALQLRFEGWRRKHGGRGKRIPEVLWSEAARVARAEGVPTTARALGLRGEGLKERVDRCGGSAVDGVHTPAFVELNGMGVLGGSRAVVELVSPRGEQMRVHLMGASPAELVGLAEAFWSRRS